MADLINRIRAGEILVADGAMGSMLLDRGLKAGECPEKLNIERPEIIEEISRSYVEAGADIIQTNTFGASPVKLAGYGLQNDTERINIAAVSITRKVAGDNVFISASCGPCGHLLKPYGEIEPDEVYESFRRQFEVLINEGVDMICIETMVDVAEACLAIKAAKSISSSIPLSASVTFDATPKGFYTIMGNNIEQVMQEIEKAGADIVGSNCGNGIVNMVKIAEEIKARTKLPVIIQSNAGLPVLEGEKVVYRETPEFMAEKILKLLELKVNIIGGCCGTTPEHINAFRKRVDEYVK